MSKSLVLATAALVAFWLSLPAQACGQEVRPVAVDPNAAPAPPVPLVARFGYYPLYNPVYNRAYFDAWAQAYRDSAPSVAFQDGRTTVYAPGYAAYYYTSRYYSPKYAPYYWYAVPGR